MADDVDELILFIQDIFETKGYIPLHEPRFNGNELKYITDTIKSSVVSSIGSYVDKFEEEMSSATKTRKAIAVVNGTAALHVSLRLAGVKPEEEVITQALSFIATANAICYNGAKPVFLDVDFDTMGLSPDSVRNFLEEFGEIRKDGCYNRVSGSRISACLPMHTFGFPVRMNELLDICSTWNIPVVEDAAGALGSIYRGKPVGSLGQFGIFSLNGNKIITAGGGGIIVTNDITSGDLAKHLISTAKISSVEGDSHDLIGYNYRMPNLNAALACAQIEQLEGFLSKKRDLANKYATFLEGKKIKFRSDLQNSKANYWLMCVEMENREEKENFLDKTKRANIKTQPIWQLLSTLSMYRNCFSDDQKNAMKLKECIVNIPSNVSLK